MIPRLKPYIGLREFWAAFIQNSSGSVELFEAAFAKTMGQKFALAFPHGRTGLVCLLQALGLEGMDVICPAYTCVVVPHAIVTSGNSPIFIDSREYDFNMDLDQLSDHVTGKTGAVIATSIFGYPVDLEALSKFKEKFPHIHVIQDCAHSFGAEWKGLPVHQAGVAALFGLNVSKTITSIFGGMITTDDEALFRTLQKVRARLLAPATLKKEVGRRLYLIASTLSLSPVLYSGIHYIEQLGLLDRFVKYYDEDVVEMPRDWQTEMTNVEARVGLAQLKRYDSVIRFRRQAAETYDQLLSETDSFLLPPLIDGATYSHYTLRTPHREQLIQYAAPKGVQLGRLIEYVIPRMGAYKNMKGSMGEFPVATQMAKEALNLPVWVGVDVEKVVSVLRGAL